MKYEIDLKDVNTRSELYDLLEQKLPLPDYTGRNLDALYDVLGRESALRLKEKEIIEVVPLAYMRGRTLDNSFIILDEAQNTTPEQRKMFLTRMGFGSKVVVTGDITQIDLPEDKIDEAMNISGRHVSVDAPFTSDEDSSLLDVLTNDDTPTTDMALVEESLKSEIQEALGILNERERNIIEASYGINQTELTLEEIGEKYNLSRERVRQIKEKAIRKLRTCTKNKTLKTYLG